MRDGSGLPALCGPEGDLTSKPVLSALWAVERPPARQVLDHPERLLGN